MKNKFAIIGVVLLILVIAKVLFGFASAPDFKTSEPTMDNVKAVVEYNLKNKDEVNAIKNINVTDMPQGKNITIDYLYKDSFSGYGDYGYTYVTQEYAIDVMEPLFENSKVYSVTMNSYGTVTDNYGKKSDELGIKITINRPTADKIDWQGIKNNLHSRALLEISDSSYRNPESSGW